MSGIEREVDTHFNNKAIRDWAPTNYGLDGGLVKHSKRMKSFCDK